nr:low-density lipoprotein receptor-related protein 2-like [Aotus nancymaae]
MDIGVSDFGPETAIDRSMAMSEDFVMEMGKQPIIFENPMYSAARDSAVKVVQPAQVRNHAVLHFSYCCRWILIY